MFARPLQLLAFGALITAGAATQASACCGWCAALCGVPVPVVAVGPLPPVYVVNQGPVYSGPSIITYPGYFEALAWPRFYPSVDVGYHYPWYSEPAYYPYAHYGHYRRPIGRYYR
jgi:hypothetical protein